MTSQNVRYQVFVSSSYRDLQQERQQVMQALLELDCIPAGMELFPAANDDQWTLIQRVIDDSDYYVLIIGGRYGSTTADGISYTEREFDYAAGCRKQIIAFPHLNPDDLAAKNVEMDREARERLSTFRNKVETGRTCKYWSTAAELGGLVSRAIAIAIRDKPTEGWVRGRVAVGPELLVQLNDLRDENERLKSDIAALRQAPQDAKDYQGGEDLISIHGSFVIQSPTSEGATWEWEAKPTWNEIFSEIGPLMFDECNEAKMGDALASVFIWWDPDVEGKGKLYHVRLYHDYLNTLKIQLFALGLIQKSTKKHAVSDRGEYWKLTPYGESQLLKLRALRKEN